MFYYWSNQVKSVATNLEEDEIIWWYFLQHLLLISLEADFTVCEKQHKEMHIYHIRL